MSAASRRESQEEILDAALASLTDADIPPADDELYGWPDPEFDRPAALAGLDGAELEELAADASVPAIPGWPLSFQAPTGPEAWPAGFGSRDRSGDGPGFADGGVLDVLAAGLPLAGFAADTHDRLVQVTDDELVGVLRAWRRVTSWAAASELAADEASLLVPDGAGVLAGCLVELGGRLSGKRRAGWVQMAGTGFRSSL